MTRELLLMFFAMAAPVPAQTADAGVSVMPGQPAYYGRLDVGGAPQPQLVSPQPVVIQPVRSVVHQPLHLRVPNDHRRQWQIHCYKYDACTHPVYFVQERWYKEVYTPHSRQQYGHRDGARGRDREFD